MPSTSKPTEAEERKSKHKLHHDVGERDGCYSN
jgi:hypothetical protein